MVESATPELQVAATQVLGELQPKEPAIARALERGLASGEILQARFVLEALAKIGTPEAVRVLVGYLNTGGPHIELVGRLLGQLGAGATKALGAVFENADAELQSRILEILGRHTDREALRTLLRAIFTPHPTLSAKAAAVMEEQIDSIDDKGRQLIQETLHKGLSAKAAADLAPESLANALRVLGHFNDAATRTCLLRSAGAKYAPIVRQAALLAMKGMPLTATQSDSLLGLLTEGDMTHVVRPAMEVLAGVAKWGSGGVQRLKKLLELRNEELSLFALRALRSCHTAEMAKICMKHLTGGKPAWQEVAADALGENPAAVEGLLRALQSEKNPDRARLLATPLARLGNHLEDAQITAWAEKACKHVIAGDPMGDVLLDLLLRLSPDRGRVDLVDRALRLRRARKLPECLAILMRLARTEHIDLEGRYQLAVARLLTDQANGQVDRSGGVGDATMGYFTTLVRAGFPLVDRLKKETQLTAEALLRLGSHFAEGVATERRFGVDLLQFVADRHGKQRAGEEARTVLRVEGF